VCVCVCVCVRVCVCVCVCVCVFVQYIHTIHMYIQDNYCSLSRLSVLIYMHTHTHTHTLSLSLFCTHTHTYTHTHTHTNTHTHTKLVCGSWGKCTLGGSKNGLFYALINDYNPRAAVRIMNRLSKVASRYVCVHTHTHTHTHTLIQHIITYIIYNNNTL